MPTTSFGTDFAYTTPATSPESYLCMKNAIAEEGTYRIASPTETGVWHWWDASDSDLAFKFMDIPGLSQFISNNDKFFVCNAKNNVPAAITALPVSAWEPLPHSDSVIDANSYGYQYWPDSDYDHVSNAREISALAADNPTLFTCKNDAATGDPRCSCNAQDSNCQGPMSLCEYVDSKHINTLTLPGDATDETTAKGYYAIYCKLPYDPLRHVSCDQTANTDETSWTFQTGESCPPEISAGLINGQPASNDKCFNHLDDDHNGVFDCNDPKCYANIVTSEDLRPIIFGVGGPWEDCTVAKELDCRENQPTGDEDGDTKENCDDPDCANTPPCKGEQTQVFRKPHDESLVCMSGVGGDNQIIWTSINTFYECCPLEKPCVNQRLNVHVVNPGLSWSVIDNANEPYGGAENSKEGKLWELSETKTIHMYIPLDSTSAIGWSMAYEDPAMKIKFEEGTHQVTLLPADWKQYLKNEEGPYIWHKLEIPRSALSDINNIEKITFDTSGKVYVDNVYWLPRSDSGFSLLNKVCAGDGSWVTDYDLDTTGGACNGMNPQDESHGGAGGFGWTGTKCCGDDKTGSSTPSFENFADSERGCFGGHVIYSNKVVGDVFKTELLSAPKKDTLKDVIYIANPIAPDTAGFYVCGKEKTTYDSRLIFDGTAVGSQLIPTANKKDTCAVLGSHFCNQSGVWLDRSKESSTWEESGKQYRCVNGEKKEVIRTYDWLARSFGECNEKRCFCPPTTPRTGETIPTTLEGLEECNDPTDTSFERLDRQFCVASGTIKGDHFCNEGTWTSRTAIVAGYLYSLVQSGGKYENNDYVLMCNLPTNTLYEEYLGEFPSISKDDLAGFFDTACVLHIKDETNPSQTQTVILGMAVNTDKGYTDFAYSDASGDLKGLLNTAIGCKENANEGGPRLGVNYAYCKDEERNLKFADAGSDFYKIENSNDKLRMYWLTDASALFAIAGDEDFSVGDLKNYNDDKPESYIEKIQAFYTDIFSSLFSWAIPAARTALHEETFSLTKNMNGLYAARHTGSNGVPQEMVVSYESRADSDYVTAQFKGFNDCTAAVESAFSNHPDAKKDENGILQLFASDANVGVSFLPKNLGKINLAQSSCVGSSAAPSDDGSSPVFFKAPSDDQGSP
jgi:hypothetical protein